MDCLAVGDFLSRVNGEFYLMMANMDDRSVRVLIKGILQMTAQNWRNQPSVIQSEKFIFFLCCSIQDGGFASIAQLLQSPICPFIVIYGSDMGKHGLQCLARALLHNTTLKKLAILYCDATDEGIKSLAEVLMVNKSLEYLILAGSRNISGEGLSYLAESLKCNSTLKHLDLSVCGSFMTETVLESFATALVSNETLQVLIFDQEPSWRDLFSDLEEFFSAKDLQLMIDATKKSSVAHHIVTNTEVAALAERLQASGVLQQLLAIAIKKTVKQFGEERTASALAQILEDWSLDH